MFGVNLRSFSCFIGRTTAMYGAAVVVSGFVSFFFDLAIATLTQRFFIAAGLIEGNGLSTFGIKVQSVFIEGALLVFSGLLRAISFWVNGYLTAACQISVETSSRMNLTKWAIGQGGQPIGLVMSYYNDVTVGSAVFIGNIFSLLSKFILLLGVVGILLISSFDITCIVFTIIIVIVPIQIIVDRIVSNYSRHIQSSLEKSVSLLSSAIKNNLFIFLHNMVESEVEKIDLSISSYRLSSMNYYALSNIRAYLPQVLGLIAVVVVAIQGGIFFSDNISAMVVYLYMVLRLFQVLSDMARVSGNLRLNYPRIALLYKWWCDHVLHQDQQMLVSVDNAPLGQDDHHLVGWKAQNLSFVWPNGKKTAIESMNFTIHPGQVALIVGPSGAGKTTLFHLLLGLLSPTSGQLSLVNEKGDERLIDGRIPRVISYVGPEPFLVAGSVRDQLLIGNQAIPDDELARVLKLVHADFVFEFKEGLGHVLTEQGQGLSAGQKQRLSLARALLRKPSVLLLDEATANLDSETERQIVDLINSLKGAMSIVVVSHRPHPDLKVDMLIDLSSSSVETAFFKVPA